GDRLAVVGEVVPPFLGQLDRLDDDVLEVGDRLPLGGLALGEAGTGRGRGGRGVGRSLRRRLRGRLRGRGRRRRRRVRPASRAGGEREQRPCDDDGRLPRPHGTPLVRCGTARGAGGRGYGGPREPLTCGATAQ